MGMAGSRHAKTPPPTATNLSLQNHPAGTSATQHYVIHNFTTINPKFGRNTSKKFPQEECLQNPMPNFNLQRIFNI
jgi:hypothetical protein